MVRRIEEGNSHERDPAASDESVAGPHPIARFGWSHRGEYAGTSSKLSAHRRHFAGAAESLPRQTILHRRGLRHLLADYRTAFAGVSRPGLVRSEEHTSEL